MNTHEIRSVSHHLPVFFLLATLILLICFVAPAAAQVSKDQTGEEQQLRNRVAEALSKGDTEAVSKMLSEMTMKKNQPGQKAAIGGSVFFERITGCGFYPQETRLMCTIDIYQSGGYGGPIETFGSTEHVYFCVDWNGNGVFDSTESVGQGSVVMHDGAAKTNYAVYRDINIPGGLRTVTSGPGTATTTTKAPILSAQATLSWMMPPTGCNFSPIWGNVFNFRIRLDPIR